DEHLFRICTHPDCPLTHYAYLAIYAATIEHRIESLKCDPTAPANWRLAAQELLAALALELDRERSSIIRLTKPYNLAVRARKLASRLKRYVAHLVSSVCTERDLHLSEYHVDPLPMTERDKHRWHDTLDDLTDEVRALQAAEGKRERRGVRQRVNNSG